MNRPPSLSGILKSKEICYLIYIKRIIFSKDIKDTKAEEDI